MKSSEIRKILWSHKSVHVRDSAPEEGEVYWEVKGVDRNDKKHEPENEMKIL